MRRLDLARGLLRMILIIGVAAGGSGCDRIRYRVSAPSGETFKDTHWNNYFFWGLVPVQETYTLDSICPAGKLVEVRTFRSAPNLLATGLGLGLTSASNVESVCLK